MGKQDSKKERIVAFRRASKRIPELCIQKTALTEMAPAGGYAGVCVRGQRLLMVVCTYMANVCWRLRACLQNWHLLVDACV